MTEACARGSAVAGHDEILPAPEIMVSEYQEPAEEDDPAYTSLDLDEELEEILDELEDPTDPTPPAEKEAIKEYVEAKKQNKYLFDGTNLIHIQPQRTTKRKAFMGKAVWLRKQIVKKMSSMTVGVIEKAAGIYNGMLTDYIPKCGPPIPPILYHCVKEIERREPITLAWVYTTPGGNRQINKVKRRFMRGNIPNVSK